MKLFFVRHGETLANAEGRIQSQVPPPAFGLSPAGRQQAEELRERFEREGLKPTHLYCSPLRRTQETAEIISRSWSLPITYWDDLMEHGLGIVSGLTVGEIREKHPEIDVESEEARGFSGVEGAEALATRRKRGQRVVDEALRLHRDDDAVVMVCHGGIIQQMVAAVMQSSRVWAVPVKNTAVFEFAFGAPVSPSDDDALLDNYRLWRIVRFNDASHLRRLA